MNASVHEASKVLRVLEGRRLKYTVRVTHPDGKVTEFQSDGVPTLDWVAEDRRLWVCQHAESTYSKSPVMRFEEGMVILTEENPK